jgi:hypothetical protein
VEVGKWEVGSYTAVRGRPLSGGTAGIDRSGRGRGCGRERWL